ncbi:type II secretion system minor pseudopilin GspI [Parvularcula sp. IMCC14364]|uniref:type II secretion system minor pseudopilin GspI n=1 Tax=Parvularcula sp. IMCC14364 TaxID=3067902 RepID=UPI0027417FA1|nr:type II secretion system minor pseudopilin GspI [Parvularcula sp. IMCC14364]
MSSRSIAGNQKGFTLTEVLIAMFILSTAIVALLALIAQSVRTTADIEQRVLAGIVAENVMTETLAPFSLPQTLASEGEAELAGQVWIWERELAETVADGMFRVTVTVRPGDSNQVISSVTAFREGGL